MSEEHLKFHRYSANINVTLKSDEWFAMYLCADNLYDGEVRKTAYFLMFKAEHAKEKLYYTLFVQVLDAQHQRLMQA